ncbi:MULTISPECIES: GtrA family protein [unclassified Mesorhizobium]|uniref:GtrA family protein n=1 Tax=unclassified Mesorhizobium TaxID=325217 RepID=UPI000F76245E|nr:MULTISPECIES: GtrA family protein [unclassified Mesorhizobium]AZO04341.1 GtrA family protein [Mesorhizobium sp. M2A.F.Ca.ET.043.02.1.1]RUW38246.1 GtrA family protein [Mesorhizobium sp. M2A.F.Ca.ET.015.02.1.1]RUW78710.1 GtrA family protein [Mesorhizobium sp. M2A.F.Ca.ET.067.02.1.1]RVC94669.1 GtrA family protein [Mesorhizobium sp. M2A.F.Ca.ET.017.03.2.1]RVD08044.1 GtrA family protein [Mesorhizobium sp. M2A.F.Ca.ET.029.05.1.1]
MGRLIRFTLAGGIGFAADAAALWLLLAAAPLGALSARVLSIGFALCVTWQINRHVTFAPSSRSIAEEGARYGGVGIATSIVNYLVYCAVLLALPALPPLAALVIASIVAMTLSFLGYSRLVFDR